ncbi:zinc-dependent alcohol dehydrogenase (plasmid) [Bradyrhizobium elkanii USDA 61]|nr:zinc-dependent alcohol dehydrogenase [Bradyrhizobium elkanii USDA 61]
MILGNKIDDTKAEYVRTPHADTSLPHLPDGVDEEAFVMLSDILPTGFECGVLNGKISPGSAVAIVRACPVGLATLLTAQFYSPAEVIMIDLDDKRLAIARQFGATQTVNSADGKAVEKVRALTGEMAWMLPLRPSAYRRLSNFARTSSRRAVSWRTLAYTASRSICTWIGFGPRTYRSPRGWWTPSRRPCC